MTAIPPVLPAPPRVAGVATTGVADTRLAPVLTGTPRTARVLHAGPDALYLAVDDTCVGILSARAVRVPCGVRTLLPVLPAVTVGAPALVGAGSVELEGFHLTVVPKDGTQLPRLPREALAGAAHLLRPTADSDALVAATAALLPAASLRRLAAADVGADAGAQVGAVTELLGLGPGLTPLGDDVLCGWLALQSAVHPAPAGAAEVRDAVRDLAPTRTTTLSATLLTCAADGATVPEFHTLIAGLAAHDRAQVRRGVDALVRIGATSGAGLVLGTALGLTAASGTDHARPFEEGPAR